MSSEVIAQMPMSRERSIASLKSAFEWPLTIVYPLVCLQVALLCEALSAAWEIACERFLASVGALMDFQSASPRVTLAANVTDERLVARMDQLMGLQVSFRDKFLSAIFKRADKGSLSRMNPQMRLQVPGLLELSQTVDKRAK